MYDILIQGGRVLDGAGAPWYRADVAVVGDSIATVGMLDGRDAALVVDAVGCFVAPGFVEEHSHSDGTLIVDPLAQSAVRQGITTLVNGLCGMSAAPMPAAKSGEYRRAAPLFDYEGLDWTWGSMGEYLDVLREGRPSVNVVALVGHMPVRALAMGEANRPANRRESADMRAMVARALDEGARGFSTGLTYQHTAFADTNEIAEAARAVRGRGWAYHTHIRDQGRDFLASVAEAIEISRLAEAPLVVSHMYPASPRVWGEAAPALEMLERARDRGQEVGFDVTPWPRGGGPIAQMLSPWARDGGIDATLERLGDPGARSRVAAELEAGEGHTANLDWEDCLVCHVSKRENSGWLGRSIAELAEGRGMAPSEAAALMLLEDEAGYWIAPTIKSDEDVDLLIKHPLSAIVADGMALAPEGPLGNPDKPNSYGTFPRALGRYVRERGVLTWEEAVSKMTSVPAQRVGLWDRGILRPNMKADLVVFNPDTVIEKATYASPQEYPEGIPWVIVNGKVTVSPDGHTGARAGVVV